MELSRTTFRRLVQLYLLLWAASIVLIVGQLFNQLHHDFDREFVALSERYYGPQRESDLIMALSGGLLIMHTAGAIGLLWFQRWARLIFWMALVVLLVIDSATGSPVAYFDQWASWSEFLGSGIFGAILVISYASGFGAEWFAAKAKVNAEGS
jgi:hypothetical protein